MAITSSSGLQSPEADTHLPLSRSSSHLQTTIKDHHQRRQMPEPHFTFDNFTISDPPPSQFIGLSDPISEITGLFFFLAFCEEEPMGCSSFELINFHKSCKLILWTKCPHWSSLPLLLFVASCCCCCCTPENVVSSAMDAPLKCPPDWHLYSINKSAEQQLNFMQSRRKSYIAHINYKWTVECRAREYLGCTIKANYIIIIPLLGQYPHLQTKAAWTTTTRWSRKKSEQILKSVHLGRSSDLVSHSIAIRSPPPPWFDDHQETVVRYVNPEEIESWKGSLHREPPSSSSKSLFFCFSGLTYDSSASLLLLLLLGDMDTNQFELAIKDLPGNSSGSLTLCKSSPSALLSFINPRLLRLPLLLSTEDWNLHKVRVQRIFVCIFTTNSYSFLSS